MGGRLAAKIYKFQLALRHRSANGGQFLALGKSSSSSGFDEIRLGMFSLSTPGDLSWGAIQS